MPQLFHLQERSSNRKTGPIAVSTSSAVTCPDTCSLKRSRVCYAMRGPLSLHWRAVTAAARGLPFGRFLAAVRALPRGSMFRHNAAGDLPGRGGRINGRQLAQLVDAARGLVSWTYTHKHSPAALAAVRSANARGSMVINLSADSAAEADRLAAAAAGPVTAVLPRDFPPGGRTPGGRLVAVCPAQLRPETSCLTCGNGSPLCARPERAYVIGFRQH